MVIHYLLTKWPIWLKLIRASTPQEHCSECRVFIHSSILYTCLSCSGSWRVGAYPSLPYIHCKVVKVWCKLAVYHHHCWILFTYHLPTPLHDCMTACLRRSAHYPIQGNTGLRVGEDQHACFFSSNGFRTHLLECNVLTLSSSQQQLIGRSDLHLLLKRLVVAHTSHSKYCMSERNVNILQQVG